MHINAYAYVSIMLLNVIIYIKTYLIVLSFPIACEKEQLHICVLLSIIGGYVAANFYVCLIII